MTTERCAPGVDLTVPRGDRKPTLILHIGSGKSGSSAIQHFLFRNRARLAAKGILIPDGRVDLAEHPGGLVFFLQSLVRQPDAPNILKSMVDKAIDRFGRERFRALVLSAENLANENGLHESFRLLRQDFELCVIFYIRRQEDFYLSAWQQWYAKTGLPLQSWLADLPADLGDWAAAIDRWESLQPEAFAVRVYERSELRDGDVVSDFCGILGLEPADFELAQRSVNESFGVHVSSLYSDVSPVFESINDRRVERLLYDFDVKAAAKRSNETVFTREQLEFIRDRHAAGNLRIKQRFFPGRVGNSPFANIDYEALKIVPQDEINRRNLALIAELLFKYQIKQSEIKANVDSKPIAKASAQTVQERPLKKGKFKARLSRSLTKLQRWLDN